MIILQTLKRIYGLITGSSFLWKIVRNYAVLSASFKAIEGVIQAVSASGRSLPNQDESLILVKAFSNILKTGVIDIPGVDEYELAMNLDMVNSNMSLGIEDLKTGKYFEIPTVKKVEGAK